MIEFTASSAEQNSSVVDMTKFIEEFKRIEKGTELLERLMRNQTTFTEGDLSAWKRRLEHWKQTVPRLAYLIAASPVETNPPLHAHGEYFRQQLDAAISELSKEIPADHSGRVEMHYEALKNVTRLRFVLKYLIENLESVPAFNPPLAGNIQQLAPVPDVSIPNGVQDLLADVYLLDAIGSQQDILKAQQLTRQYLQKIVRMYPRYIDLE